MITDVILTVKGTQSSPDAEPEVIELVTYGQLESLEDGQFNLSYDETEMTGLEGTRTTFQIAPDSISLVRTGTFQSHMMFEIGRRHLSVYETPYGALSMAIGTRRMHADLTPQGGTVEIEYSVELEHNLIGDHAFFITVREA